MSDRDAKTVIKELTEEIALAESSLGGAMMGIADSYMELAYGAGRGYGVHAQYRENNLNTGKPVSDLAHELAAWAAEINAKAAALDAKREMLERLKAATGLT
jgi:hypothetical protein